jgi:hypothetical protein
MSSRDGWKSTAGRCGIAVIVAAGLFATAVSLGAQDGGDRRLWDTEFRQKRQTTRPAPAAPGRPAAPAPAPQQPPPVYTRADAAPATVAAAGEMLGITIWRLRAPRTSDAADSRLLIQEDAASGQAEWTPERVEAGTSFTAGERVRLSIESPRTGFLYVIDREQYDDGSTSEPYLIFPTLRMRGGDNAVAAGKVIELPQGSAFRLRPMRPDYRGELLTLLVTPNPLPGISPAAGIQKLERAVVDTWQRQWGADAERFEMVGGAGASYGKGDREAGVEGRLLTQEDPLPQTLLRVAANSSQPLMVDIALRISR